MVYYSVLRLQISVVFHILHYTANSVTIHSTK